MLTHIECPLDFFFLKVSSENQIENQIKSSILLISELQKTIFFCVAYFYNFSFAISPGNYTLIKRTVVLETGVSRHHGSPIKDPFEAPQTSRQYVTEEFQEDS